MVDEELEFMKFRQGKVKEAIERLKGLQRIPDIEVAHYEADDILCELVSRFISTEVTDEWAKVPKWYA